MATTSKLRLIDIVQIFVCSLVFWCAWYFLFRSFSGHGILFDGLLVLNLAAPTVLLFAIGIIINLVGRSADKVPLFRMAISIIILFALDQGIKLAVVQNQDAVMPIIDDWLEYHVIQNTNPVLKGQKIYILVLVYALIPLLPILIFRVGKFYRGNAYLFSMAAIFFYSGIFSSYFDNFFYGGSYDYIGLKQLGILDLKDIYVFIAGTATFQACFYQQSLKTFKQEWREDPLGLRYFRYEFANIKRFFSKEG